MVVCAGRDTYAAGGRRPGAHRADRSRQPTSAQFYHTDPTGPGYISHVASYLGNGKMIQAPQPGQNVEVVPADTGNEFVGAVRVDPALAVAVADSAT